MKIIREENTTVMQHNTTIFKFIVAFVGNFVLFCFVGGFGLFQVGFGWVLVVLYFSNYSLSRQMQRLK